MVQSDRNIGTKLTKIREHMLSGSTCSNLREYEGASLSSQDLLHHEDSGIEISSMKKDDNLEDFLQRARKVSSIMSTIVITKLISAGFFRYKFFVCSHFNMC